MGFIPKIPVFERAKTFHALDRATTVISPSDCGTDKLRSLPMKDLAQLSAVSSSSLNLRARVNSTALYK
jgi:hypothetical protein